VFSENEASEEDMTADTHEANLHSMISNISIPITSEEGEMKLRRFVRAENGYLWSLGIEANNVAVRLYKIAEYLKALQLFNMINDIMIMSQNESNFSP